ncbi:MAG: DNA repair protein RecO [Gammaproteobacteria bacterium]|nr:DNA repair protein RecO [Gammaproteobacteria bacterium]
MHRGYILHRRPYRDTSHILDVFTEEHGRLGLVARGGRGRREWQGLLQPFVPLLLSWSGRGELATLTAIESAGAAHSLAGTPLLCGFYLNELLLRLLQRFDPHAQLFNVYATTLSVLARVNENPGEIEWGLRIFERDLLQELGYGLVLDHDVETGDPIQETETYRYVLGHGPVWCESDLVEHAADAMLHGHSLLALHQGQCHDPGSLREVKRLMRAAIDQQLAGRPLHSRRLLRDLHAY